MAKKKSNKKNTGKVEAKERDDSVAQVAAEDKGSPKAAPEVNGTEPKTVNSESNGAVEHSEKANGTANGAQKRVESESNGDSAAEKVPVATNSSGEAVSVEEGTKQVSLEKEPNTKAVSEQKQDQEPEQEQNTQSKELEELRQKLQAAEQLAQKHENNYTNLLSRISSMKSVFHKMKEAQDQLSETQEQLDHKETELKQKVHELDITQKKYQELLKTNVSLNDEIKQETRRSKSLQEQIYRLESKVDGIEANHRNETEALQSELQDRSVYIAKIKEQNEEYFMALQEANSNKKQSDKEITGLQSIIEEKSSVIGELNAAVSRVERDKEALIQKLESERTRNQKQETALKEAVEKGKNEIERLQQQLKDKETKVAELEVTANKAERLEEEVKEKQLIIGKLRHEAIILNEHLTKALGLIQKNKESNTVDKELISNLVLKFVALPRGDSKKFEVLSLIGSYLDWNDEEKVQAGLKMN